MKEHLKAFAWPREGVSGPEGKLYRYAIVGMLVTDEPLVFEGENEVLLDGVSDGLARAVERVARRKSKLRVGDAADALLSLRDA